MDINTFLEMSVIIANNSKHSTQHHMSRARWPWVLDNASLLLLSGCFSWLYSPSFRCTLIFVIVRLHRLLPLRQEPGFLSVLWGVIAIVLIDVRPLYGHVQLGRRRRLLLGGVGLRGWHVAGLPDLEFLRRPSRVRSQTLRPGGPLQEAAAETLSWRQQRRHLGVKGKGSRGGAPRAPSPRAAPSRSAC